MRAWHQAHAASAGDAPARGVLTIPVAFHVVHDGAQGDVPDEQIEDQIAVLNEGFSPIGFEFVLASVDRTDNAAWYCGLEPGTPEELQMKQALAVDPARVLNVYTVRPAGGLLGWAYFPFSFPEGDVLDGLVLLDEALPGGSVDPYAEGDAAVHEIGHWMGLLHLFGSCEGGDTLPGCETTGDLVCDTPAMSMPALGCPVGQDSCPTGDPDPVHNYMSLSTDACRYEFTPGQGERAHALIALHRPTLAGTATATEPAAAPAGARLGAAYPNPTRGAVTVPFTLDRAQAVTLRVYDAAGRLVAVLAEGKPFGAGTHALRWDVGSVPAGPYLVRLAAGLAVPTERVVVLR